MPSFDQVARARVRAGLVVGAHGVDARVVELESPDPDRRQPSSGRRVHVVHGQMEGVEDDPVDAAVADLVQVGALAVGVAVAAADERAIPVRLEALFEAARQDGIERVRDVGKDQRDHVRLPGPEAPGRTTRPVAERVDRTLDPLARAGRDGPLPRKDVRDGGLAHLGVPSDINDRAARLSRKPFHSGERRPARRSLSTPTSRGTPREIGCEAWSAACTTRRPRHRTQR